MAIQWDSVLVRGVGAALQERLRGARLRAFQMDHSNRSLALFFRTGTLTFRLHPSRGDAVLGEAREPGETSRPLPAKLGAVVVRTDDRVLCLRFRRVRGRPALIDIPIELMTNQWNALVVESESGIIRHALWSRNAGDRPLHTGSVYRLPRESERVVPDGMSLERWRELVPTGPTDQRRRDLLRRVAFTSKLNADEFLGDDVDQAYRRWLDLAAQPLGDACVFPRTNSLQPYPHLLRAHDCVEVKDLLVALDRAALWLDQEVGDTNDRLDATLAKALERAVHRARGRVIQLTRQLETAPDASALRGLGDLLLAKLHEVVGGDSSVTLVGFDGTPVQVSLDPSLGPAENARAYYERASRSERASARVPELLASARSEMESLEDLQSRARVGDATADEVRQRVPVHSPRSGAPSEGPSLPYRTYRSSGGLEIRVGRGSRFNDDLTFHHSAPNDVWLHARHAAGAHVVLRWSQDGSPPGRDLEEAAVLAALHSKARTSGSVPVDWTRRKYVRKPRKAPRGTVTLERAKTVFVEPDPDLEAKLSS